ncbi:pyridoxamine 5'-phosphate oxidase family protein [Pseudonocardia kujensis]|uniref:pyridoxamine 5'-phosphate oxidase family protein n=1 Tax=Pseudonocardia kujensis TaxID=1128675 RepID=UPI001E51F198|nr:pyridoxamine 5'-phosphate oxidase family protein [Pseudonocardia kujensis]MCE0762079.1 pyridoxamine 5'-phosphate oxidase family protein [Pseudonocardia kujensis]
MSRRDGIMMTPAEIAAFLDTEKTVILGVPGPEVPHLTAMWFVRRGSDLLLWTHARSQKAVSARRHGRASVLVESGTTYETLRGISADCDVKIVDDADEVLAIGAALADRYGSAMLTADTADGKAAQLRATGRRRIGLVLHPTRYRTWDHHKLGAASSG